MISRLNVFKIILIQLACLYVLASCGEPLLTPTVTPTYNPTTGPVMKMTGTLVKQDGTSLSGATIMATDVNTVGASAIIGPDGVALNPDGIVDQNNSFILYVSKAFLEAVGYKFKLTILPTNSYAADLLDLNGKPLVVTVNQMGAALALGPIPVQ